MLKNKNLTNSYINTIKCAATWHNAWHFIHNHTDSKLQMKMEALYKNLNKKIDILLDKQRRKTKHQPTNQIHRFYQRTINLTNIKFTKEEQTILNYGLQLSLEKTLRTYCLNRIIETERAIKLLNSKIQNLFHILATKKLKQIYNSVTSILHKNATYMF